MAHNDTLGGRRLVLVDDYDGGWLERAAAAPGRHGWDVLLLSADERWYRERHRSGLAVLGDCRFLDLTGFADRAQDEVRDFLVPFIADMPRRTGPDGGLLIETLGSPQGNWWWYLETAEKSPMRTPLVSQLYALAVLHAALAAEAYAELWIALSDQGVTELLQGHVSVLPPTVVVPRPAPRRTRGWVWYWLQALRYVAEVAACRAIGRWQRWPVSAPSDGSVLFFSFFPNWWAAPYSPQAADRFFPDLPPAHRGRALAPAIWLTESVRGLWQKRHQIGTALSSRPMILLQQYVDFRSAVELLSAGGFLRARRFCRDCARHLTGRFAGFDVQPLVLADIRQSFTVGELFRDRLLAGAIERMSSAVHLGALVFRTEGQPCDSALAQGVGDRSLSVGFWHVPIERRYLPLHFGPGSVERALSGHAPFEAPVPQRMLVTGSAGSDALERQGYPTDRIGVCGAVRQPQLARCRATHPGRDVLRRRLALPAGIPMLFAATSVVHTDSEGLLSALAEALPEIGEFRLVVKLHPALPLDPAFLEWVFARLSRERAMLMPDAASMYDYIAASDAIVTGGSTIAFEAMALGVVAITFENPGAFSASSLADFADACFVTRSADELRFALDQTMRGGPLVDEKRRRAESAVDRVFAFIDAAPMPKLLDALEQFGAFGQPLDAAAIARS